MNSATCRVRKTGLLVVSTWLVMIAGCTRPTHPTTVVPTTRVADDSVASVTELLRRGADVEAWRAYTQQLNHYLDEHPNALLRLSKDDQQLLATQFRLDKAELAEVENGTFTPLDAHYLELAFVLRDAARALNLEDLTPLDQVTQAFRWVVRQVRLQQGEAFAVPPLPVLRRGWGTARGRDLAFLALLDQLGIDGCMVTLPAGMPGQAQPRDWVPGALIGNDIFLFDTRLGLPLPGPSGQGVATLAQVRAGLDLRPILKTQDAFAYDVGPESTQHAEVQVAYGLSSLAPRMKFLQDYLAATEKITLWVDPRARLDRFEAAAKGTVGVWSRPGDANTSLRVLRAFLPPQEGGVAQQPLRELVHQQEIPWQYFPPLLALPGEPGQRLQGIFAVPFIYFSMQTRMPPERLAAWLPGLSEASVDKPGTRKLSENLVRSPLPRDLMLHGRFDEAATLLVAMHDELQRQKARPAGPKLEENVRRWSKRAIEAYSDLGRAEEASKLKGDEPAAAGAVSNAKERVNQLWSRPQSDPVSALLQLSMAEPMLERIVYLLALCKQEQAERLQAKQDHLARPNKSLPAAEVRALTDAWKSAAGWWRSYLNEHASAPAAPAARLLYARALQALGQREAAIALLENLSGVSVDLEKTARLYLAKQLKTR